MSSSNPNNLLGPAPASSGNNVFLYGCLMYPELLRRVVNSEEGSHLQISPAVLFSYTRLHVKDKNYPAIIPSQVATSVSKGHELTAEDQVVRGVLVQGLTAREIEYLDEFQSGAVGGSAHEFVRKELSVLPNGSIEPFATVDPTSLLSKVGLVLQPSTPDLLPAYVYVWNAGVEQLAPEIWAYDAFVNEKFGKALAGHEHKDLRQYAIGPQGGEGDLVTIHLR